MHSPAIQTYLRNGGTIASLEADLSVHCKRHGRFPNLCLFKYDQIASPMGNSVVQSARGIILDEADNWKVVAWPFNKFFNLGEGHAAEVDWSTARPFEKLDGSLVTMYFYNGEWHFATSGTPDACGPVGGASFNFDRLIRDTFEKHEGYDFRDFNPNWTYMFELTTPWNRVVVPHTEHHLTLLGMRNVSTGSPRFGFEAPPESAYELRNGPTFDTGWGKDIRTVRSFDIHSEADLLASMANFEGVSQEGYVVCDQNFNRVKVKHPQYVLLHQMVGSLTVKKALDVVRKGEISEVVIHFPEWKKTFDELRTKLDTYIQLYEQNYRRILEEMKTVVPPGVQVSEKFIRKEFAGKVMATKLPTAPFFWVYSQALSVGFPVPTFAQFFAEMNLDALATQMGVKDMEVVLE